MIRGYYTEKNELKIDGLDTLRKKGEIIWIDCINPQRKELKEISEKTGISMPELEQSLDEGERPRINLSDDYAQIIISTPNHKKGGVQTISFSIFLFNDKIITIRKRDLDIFTNILSMPIEKIIDNINKGSKNMLFFFIQEIITEYFRLTDPIEDVIEKIDSHLFKNSSDKIILKKIFDVRKTLIYFHKALVADREVFAGIESQYLKGVSMSDIKRFRFLHNDVNQLIDMVTTYREILSGSLEIYITSVSNNLNEVMKRLTVYASYVMVPTFISGIYGMNFKFMPEIMWRYGYFFALCLMVISIIAMHFIFKKKGWI